MDRLINGGSFDADELRLAIGTKVAHRSGQDGTGIPDDCVFGALLIDMEELACVLQGEDTGSSLRTERFDQRPLPSARETVPHARPARPELRKDHRDTAADGGNPRKKDLGLTNSRSLPAWDQPRT